MPETRRDEPPDKAAGHGPPDDEVRPIGAVAITAFLTLVIVATWVGMFLLNLVRS